MVNENRENWLERVNGHMENLLDNAKKDNDIQRMMAKHYPMRDKLARAKLKRAHAKIEALTKQEEKRGWISLSRHHSMPETYSQLSVHQFWPLFNNFGKICFAVFFEKFWHNQHGQMCNTLDVALFFGASNEKMVSIFGFRMMRTCTLYFF